MNRKILAGVAIAVVGVVGVSAWLWSGNSSQKNDITLLGNVDIRQVSLAFQDSERIVEMRVEEGAKVTAGQVLAVLDTRTLELQAAQTEAQIEVNKKALLRLRNGSRPEEIGQVQARVDAATTDAKLSWLGRYRRDLSTIRGMFSMLCRKAARCALSRLGARSLVTLKEYFWELDARPLPPASKME